ncbi:MAG: hypothetical protein WCP03_02540 [Candidatus Saccharibacteria bacterium]
MSEKLPSNHEHAIGSTESLKNHSETLQSTPENNLNERTEKLGSIRHGIEKQALSKEALDQKVEMNTSPPTPQLHMTRQLKAQTYKNTIKNVQQTLPKMQANFSKFIHQQNIESISEVGAKTVARPSGIFAGSLFALIGSIIIIVVAKRIGFSVTPIVFISLFLVGFLAGLVIELLFKSIKKLAIKPHKRHY